MEVHPLSDLFPAMSSDEFEALKADIQKQGLLERIVTHDGKILDGRHRYRACIELGIKPSFELYHGRDAVGFVIAKNLRRRHLNSSQLAFVGLELEKEYAKRGKEKQVKAAEQTNNPLLQRIVKAPQVKAAEQAAKAIGTNRQYVTDAKKLSEESPALAEMVKRGVITIPQAKKEAKKQVRQEQRQEMIEAAAPTEALRYSIHHGDFRVILPSLEQSDFIITDPPYPKEYLSLYEDLAMIAKDNLKQGASLLVMCGQSYFPEIIAMMSKHLDYQWLLAYTTSGGQSAQLWQRKVNTFWKPVIWFTNGEYTGEWIGDVVKSAVNDNEKSGHDWGQSTSGMKDLLSRFVFPNALVIDPFCGAGATGLAALSLDCRFIGIDIEADSVAIASKRLSDAN